MTQKSDPFAVPAWLIDAWQSAVNNSMGVSQETLIAETSKTFSQNKHKAGSWSYWNEASKLAIIGWREVVKYRESQSETDRGETGDRPS